MTQEKTVLKIDWATHEAAKYACENWHYSKCMPSNKTVKIGAWENNKFIGVVIFSPGASANLYKAYNITMTEGCELTRVALNKHITPVSKILSIAIKFLKKNNPKLRLIISFADPSQNHYGGIYQATNWIYIGKPKKTSNVEIYLNGKWTHNRSVIEKYGLDTFAKIKKENLFPVRKSSLKHKYLMPLDDEIRKKIMPLSKPYPKKCVSSVEANTSTFQVEMGGASPTDTLQSTKILRSLTTKGT